MEQNKKKGGVGKVVLIILLVLAVLGVSGYFALRAFIQSKIDNMNKNAPDLSSSIVQKAPDFTLELTDGSEAKLSELLQENEVVVLNIFASYFCFLVWSLRKGIPGNGGCLREIQG